MTEREDYRKNALVIPMKKELKDKVLRESEIDGLCAATWARMVLIKEIERRSKCSAK